MFSYIYVVHMCILCLLTVPTGSTVQHRDNRHQREGVQSAHVGGRHRQAETEVRGDTLPRVQSQQRDRATTGLSQTSIRLGTRTQW